jgi:hypothetical protein
MLPRLGDSLSYLEILMVVNVMFKLGSLMLTLVQWFGKSDYFITMTCNPYWEEVDRELFLGQTPQDSLELVARVYRSKLHNLHDCLIKKKHFGEVLAYAHVIEFQKYGLPHEHFLLVMANKDKLRSPEEF